MELGSEFDLDLSRLADTSDTVFAYLKEFHTVYTDSGRSALRLLAERLSGECILLPDYICESVPDALPGDCRILFYPVDDKLRIDPDRLKPLIREHQPRFFYLMHYFGALQPEESRMRIAAWKERYGMTVIEDTTHSLFTAKLTVGDYGIASLRKWFPAPDGGVLYTKEARLLPGQPRRKRPASKKIEAMLLKHLYLTENYDCNEKYRELFVREEEAFDRQTEVCGMSDVARFLLAHFSVEELRERRRRNAAQLEEGLRGMGMCEPALSGVPQPALAARGIVPAAAFGSADVPLAFPVYVEKRDELRERLIRRRIYCAVHWPIGHATVYEETERIGRHILSLPVDQRYGEREMEYLLECVRICGKESKAL